VQQLAAATEEEVLRMWQGLGYYSRARNLLTAARQVVALGGFPQSIDGLRSLKGVGPYTAAAIGSMAFGLPAAVVDGNVFRVLSRHFSIGTPINTTEGRRFFDQLANELLPPDRAADYNQAVMDLDMGAVDAVALDVGVARRKMADMPGKFELLGEIVMTETYGIGFKKGNTALRDEVEAELRRLAADGTIVRIAAEYGIEPQALLLK
jgi:ABC-type amino acid transport substrate-binding protein